MRDIPINRIMTTDPESVGPEFPVSAAKSILASGDMHHLPVLKNGKLVGIVSSSDLLKIYMLDNGSGSPSDFTVGHIMTTDPVVLEAQANLRDAATILSGGGFHALPVVEPDGTLVGIVTSSDLIDHLLHQIPTGDGSIESGPAEDVAQDPDESSIREVLSEAGQSVDRGDGNSELARVLLYMQKRNRLLQDVCKAAELYVRSGHGEHEHAVLVKRLSDLQDRAKRTDL
jgi:CBS domain-containing protein